MELELIQMSDRILLFIVLFSNVPASSSALAGLSVSVRLPLILTTLFMKVKFVMFDRFLYAAGAVDPQESLYCDCHRQPCVFVQFHHCPEEPEEVLNCSKSALKRDGQMNRAYLGLCDVCLKISVPRSVFLCTFQQVAHRHFLK